MDLRHGCLAIHLQFFIAADLAQAEICQFDMALSIQKYVIRLQVSVNDVLWVKVLNGESQLSHVDSDNPLIHYSESLQNLNKISSHHIL